ncbi:MAG: PPA1309 family protein, partial [Brachybacterium sp.]|nr:PPA1309 family protein [Brachybacterium sp.]
MNARTPHDSVTMPGDDPGQDLDPRTAGLAAAVLEIRRHVDAEDLSRPRWFALLPTAQMLAAQPSFAALLDEATVAAATEDPAHLTPIELEPAGEVSDPLEALEQVAWPDIAVGGALAVDLEAATWELAVPDSASPATAETKAPAGLTEQTLRAFAAALADGTTWSAAGSRGRREMRVGP